MSIPHGMAERAIEQGDVLDFAAPVLINMADRPERLADSLADLSAAVGRPIRAGRDVHLIRPVRFADPGPFANAGFRSNTHSHLRAAQWARAEGHERLLVMEDDVAFCPSWPVWGPRLLADLAGRPWHLASLGYRDAWGEAPTVPDEPLADLGGEGVVEPEPAGGIGWARFSGQVLGAHAYLLHSSAYDAWIEHLEAVLDGTPGDDLQGPMPSDGAINTFFWMDPDRIRLLAVPIAVGTRATRSDITPALVDRIPVVGPVAEVGRRWYRRIRPQSSINYS
jgi:glycosyl transferase, family 25